ncbi:hypothetical protein CRENBAI_022656 [Crenichthys baileyi]|uniref:Uncharacterized protein n=1 Tax=Crenichthys baileyi TaxID=28760 RepID=A0AAV9RI60_9TELE
MLAVILAHRASRDAHLSLAEDKQDPVAPAGLVKPLTSAIGLRRAAAAVPLRRSVRPARIAGSCGTPVSLSLCRSVGTRHT